MTEKIPYLSAVTSSAPPQPPQYEELIEAIEDAGGIGAAIERLPPGVSTVIDDAGNKTVTPHSRLLYLAWPG